MVMRNFESFTCIHAIYVINAYIETHHNMKGLSYSPTQMCVAYSDRLTPNMPA